MAASKTKSFGFCKITSYNPKKECFNERTKMVNIMLTFEEALKIGLALDEGIRSINKLNRSFPEGRNAKLNLQVNFEENRLVVYKHAF